MAENRRSKSQGSYYFSRGQLVILAVGFTVTCTITFFLGMLIGQGIEERKLIKREGQGPVAKIPTRPLRKGSSSARATPQDQEMTFYDTLTKAPPPTKARPERKTPVSQPKQEAVKQAKARVARPTVKEKKPTTRKRTERSATAPTQLGTRVWSVQVKAFARQRDASSLAKRLKGKRYDAYVVSIQIKGRTWYRVRVGRLATQREAQGLLLKLKREEKYTRAIITRGG